MKTEIFAVKMKFLPNIVKEKKTKERKIHRGRCVTPDVWAVSLRESHCSVNLSYQLPKDTFES